VDEVRRLHDEIDIQAAHVAQLHGSRLRCGLGCVACCQDDLGVFEVEAEAIRQAFPTLLAEGVPHAVGACAFLSEDGACRIYAQRPYVCRTQGLPLRWLDEDDDGMVMEMRDICPLNDEGGPAVETLEPEACWTIGPCEESLALLEERWDQGEMRRVRLRDLFTGPS